MKEENQCEDLLLFMKLLSFLTTKDYMDMAPQEDEGEGPGVESLEVVMAGIRIVLSIITEDLLKVSSHMRAGLVKGQELGLWIGGGASRV